MYLKEMIKELERKIELTHGAYKHHLVIAVRHLKFALNYE